MGCPFKRTKGTTIVNAFQSILNSFKKKTNKIWVVQGSVIYNSPFKKWLKYNVIKMYSTYNERNPAVAERFIST